MADAATVKEEMTVIHLDDFKSLNQEQKLNIIFLKLNKCESIFGDIKSLQQDITKIQSNIKTLDTNLSGLAEQFSALEKIVENHTTKIDKYKDQIDTLLKRDTEKHEKICNLITIKNNEKELKTARQEINDLEQYGRRTICVVKGIPYKRQENTDKYIKDIIAKMDTPGVDQNDIDLSHRQNNSENAGIIVKFVNRKSRNAFYNARKSLGEKGITTKTLGFDAADPIYINESLTQINGDIFKDARKRLLKTGRMRFVWTTGNGQIKATRGGEGAPTHNIRNKEDVTKLVNKYQPLQDIIIKHKK